MRVLDACVVCESVLLVALGVAWLLRTADRPELPGALPVGAGMQGDLSPRAAEVQERDAVSASQPGTRRTVETGAGADAPTLIVLRGRLLPAPGMELPADLSIGFRSDGRYRAAQVVGDQYAVSGLAPGDWILHPYADGIAAHAEVVTITTAEEQVHDLQLAPSSIVKVFLRTPDGKALLPPDTDPFLSRGLCVIALREPLHGDLPATDNSNLSGVGLGRWQDAHGFGSKPDQDGADGTLQLDEPPPLNAALMLRNLLLSQQVIPAGATEITFVVDRAALDARYATVHLRLIDGVSGKPITTGARVSFTTAQGGGASAKVDDAGLWTATMVLPGITHMEIWAKDREQLATDFRIEGGTTVELGEITLHPVVLLQGRLLDPKGEPVSGSLQWTDLDTRRARGTTANRRTTSADGDGEFSIGCGPHRFLVTARSANGAVGSTIVDASGGAPTHFDMRLADPVRVRISAAGDPLRGYALELTDAQGRLVDARRIEARWREAEFSVAPGDYTLEVYDDAESLLRKIPVHARGEIVHLEVP